MTLIKMRPSYALLLVLLSSAAFADNGDLEFGGHSKFRLVGQSFPDDSLFHDVAGDTALDAVGELRLNVQAKHHGWTFKADYQFVGMLSEFLPAGLPSDDRRLFDLTDIIDQSGDQAIAHRLDRLWVGYTGEKTVVRFGRQALSWGNGLFFAPLDLVNPFDPTAIDTEYKSGDDMLYTQYLRDNGDDVQAAVVFRRDLGGDVESDEATIAAKYHGFAGEYEYDVLVAENFGDTVVAANNVAPNYPGVYSLWLRRSGSGWELLFNDKADAWGTQHDPSSDVAAVPLVFSAQAAEEAETLSFELQEADGGATLEIAWGPYRWTTEFSASD